MLQLVPVIAQDVQPVVKMLAKLLEIAAPLEFLESANSSDLNGIIAASVLDVRSLHISSPLPSSPPARGMRQRYMFFGNNQQ